MTTYYIQASEVSGLIGLNKYNPPEKALLKLLQRHAYSKIFDILDEENLRKIEDVSKDAIHNNNVLSIWYRKSLKCQDNEKLQKMFKTIEKVINKDESISMKKDVYEEIKSSIQKRRGNLFESKGINKYEKKYKKKVTERNSQMYEKVINGLGDYKIILKAKVDGIDRINNCLVEHKNRVRRIFNEIPNYEEVQLCIYLKLTNLETCKLVQTCFEETSELEYKKNEPFWKNIKESIKKQVHIAHNLLINDKKLRKFIIKNKHNL